MSFGIVAGAVIGVGGAIYSSKQQKKANDKAIASQNSANAITQESNAEALKLQREQFDFEKSRYSDWKDIYGDLQEDVGTYYKNLTGTSMSNKEVTEWQQAQQKANTKITQELAKRGISGSGLEGSLIRENMYNTEVQKAISRATADERIMAKKQTFALGGIPQGNQIVNGMQNATAGITNGLTNAGIQANNNASLLSTLYQNQANTDSKLLGTISSTIGQTIGNRDLQGTKAGWFNG